MFVGQRVSSSSVRCSFQNSITDVPQLSESQLFSLYKPFAKTVAEICQLCYVSGPKRRTISISANCAIQTILVCSLCWKVPPGPTQKIESNSPVERPNFVLFRTSKRWKRSKHPASSPLNLSDMCLLLPPSTHQTHEPLERDGYAKWQRSRP